MIPRLLPSSLINFMHVRMYNRTLSGARTLKEQLKAAKDIFERLDTNKDGQVDFNEFSALMRRDESGRPMWLFKSAALPEQS
jgi:Ca2+-binding EF-hand superfamily protein